MQISIAFSLILLVGLVSSAPASDNDDSRLVITDELFSESYSIYSGEHEIVSLVVPLNDINFGDNTGNPYTFFFAEADRDESGKKIDKGLYVYMKGGAKKILENGRDAAAANDDTKDVYFAASDGIYWYNEEEASAEKYGSITHSIIGIAKPSESDLIYILTEDKEVYKVTENGERKELIEEIGSAEQIVLDYENNLYFLDDDNQVYIYSSGSIKKVRGTPLSAQNAQLLKPPVTSDGFVPFIADENLYLLYPDGDAELFDQIKIAPDGKPSAFAMEAGAMHYYAKDNKIYEYDIYDIAINGIKGMLGRVVDKYVALGNELLVLLGLMKFT